MSLQIALEKSLSQVNFLESTPYERHDLTNLVKPNEKLVIRQGDLIVTNYFIDGRRKKGIRYAWLERYKNENSNILTFAGTHFIISMSDKTILAHHEHGIVVIPTNKENLNFYTFHNSMD